MDSQMILALWGPTLLSACLTFSIFTSLALQQLITGDHEPAFSLHSAITLLLDIGGFIMSAQKSFLYLYIDRPESVYLDVKGHYTLLSFFMIIALSAEIEMEIQHEPLMAAITLNKIPYVCVFPGQPGALLSFGLLF